jgi:SPOR domain
LRSVAAVPLEVFAVPEEKKVIALPRPAPIVPQEGPRSSPLLWAAAIAALMSTVGTWWVVSTHSPNDSNWSGFGLCTPSEPLHYIPAAEPSASNAELLDTLSWSIPGGLEGIHQFPLPGGDGQLLTVDLGTTSLGTTAPVVPVEIAQPAKPDTTAVATRAVRARYHIIGGCFLQKENAETFVANLQARGFAATIVDQKGGLYRVAYGSYPDRSLAAEAMQAVRKEEAPEAWMLVH